MPLGVRTILPERLGRVRASAQLFDRPPDLTDPADVIRRAAGIQAQDPVASRLGVRARSRTLTAADVDEARSEDRSIVRVWAMRGTLHLLNTEDLAWQVPIYTEPELKWARGRMADGFGIDRRQQDRASNILRRMLASEGRIARKHALDRLVEKGFQFDRASVGHHLARLPVLEGFALLGPENGRETTYVVAEDWVGRVKPLERGAALAELARRYFAGFGPASDRDFASWSGLPLRDSRAGIEAISADLEEVTVGPERLWGLKGSARRLPQSPLIRMLPGFDNHYLAHRDREFAIDPDEVARVWPGGGIIRPTVTVDGKAAGTWGTKRAKGKVAIKIDPFRPFDDAEMSAIEAEVADIGRFEDAEATLS